MITTISADSNSVEEFLNVMPFFLNLKFLVRSILVLLFSSEEGVLRYSHECIAKKIAPIAEKWDISNTYVTETVVRR